MRKLLTRDEFRNSCLNRDNFACVICGKKDNLSVHHIYERRLWADGGYYQDNGATLCEKHHVDAEKTSISVSELAGKARIVPPLPPSLDPCEKYDKWGNMLLSSGQRIPGPLYKDPSVQKILSYTKEQFITFPYQKYPRTPHLPWSPGKSEDDESILSTDIFSNKEVVVTAKMDGENTSLYSNYIHARSINGRDHPSRSWVKNLHGKIKSEIPEGWRICGENMYAKHSIFYNNLPSYFLVHSIWNKDNNCLSWDETREWCQLLDLVMVQELFRGPWSCVEPRIKDLDNKEINKFLNCESEGYVVRAANSFSYYAFNQNIAKWVRLNHVRTPHNWLMQQMIPNQLTSTSSLADDSN